jgi:DNA-binding response OmpR family regulator
LGVDQAGYRQRVADLRIAIAEPDEDIAALLAQVVERSGHQPIIASECPLPDDVAVLLLEPASPSDVALARELRRRRPQLPIVCISRLEPSEEGALLDPLCYLLKPTPLRELKNAVAEAVAAGGRNKD